MIGNKLLEPYKYKAQYYKSGKQKMNFEKKRAWRSKEQSDEGVLIA